MKFLSIQIGILTALAIISGSIQFCIVRNCQLQLFYSTIAIYTFHFLITLFLTTGLYFINQKEKGYTGYAFLASSALRMLTSIIFLIPLMKENISSKTEDVFAFMIPYFIFLVFEVQCVIKLMKSEKYNQNE